MDNSIGFGLYRSSGTQAECLTCVCVWFAVVWVV